MGRERNFRQSLNRETGKTYISYRTPRRIKNQTRFPIRNSIDSTSSLKLGNDDEKKESKVFLLGGKKSEKVKHVSKNRDRRKNYYDMATQDNYDLFCKLYTLMVVAPTSKGLTGL